MPYGSFSGVAAVALPYLLRREGLTVDRIASIGALVQAPAIWYVLWAPAVDIKFRRRTWIVLLGALSGAGTATALVLTTTGALRAATLLFVLASAFNQPVSSALGGLAATVIPNDRRGHAAGWSQAGILAGGVLSGATAVWLTQHASAILAAIVVGALIAVPALAALLVAEPRHTPPNRIAHIRGMRHEVAVAMRRPAVWLGLVFFLSPCGAGALINLFSGVSVDYHATSNVVIAVVAVGGLMTAAGALVGGIMLDRIDRWRAYPTVGLLTSVVVAAMFFAPLSPATYVIGGAAYALVTGFGYATFMVLALELVGSTPTASATLFTLFTAAVNVPVVYMLKLDGAGHARFGVRGMLAADGLANAIFGVVLFAILTRFHPPRGAAGNRSPNGNMSRVPGHFSEVPRP